MSRHDNSVRLRHMLDAARKAVVLAGGKSRSRSQRTRLGNSRWHVSSKLSARRREGLAKDFRESHPGLPWNEMNGLRNRLVHAYFDVDLDVLLDIVGKDLPPLIAQLELLVTTSR